MTKKERNIHLFALLNILEDLNKKVAEEIKDANDAKNEDTVNEVLEHGSRNRDEIVRNLIMGGLNNSEHFLMTMRNIVSSMREIAQTATTD